MALMIIIGVKFLSFLLEKKALDRCTAVAEIAGLLCVSGCQEPQTVGTRRALSLLSLSLSGKPCLCPLIQQS